MVMCEAVDGGAAGQRDGVVDLDDAGAGARGDVVIGDGGAVDGDAVEGQRDRRSSTVIAAMSMVALLSMVLSAVTSMVPAPVTRAAVDRGAGERQRRGVVDREMPEPLVTVSLLSVAAPITSRVPNWRRARPSMVAPPVSVTVLLTWTMPAPVLGATSLSVMVVPLTVTLSRVSVIAGRRP